MATSREIQNRIHSVQGTQQITRAMKLVATAKLQKVKSVAEKNKPYFATLYEAIRDIVGRSSMNDSDLVRLLRAANGSTEETASTENAVGFILITSNRGLAGGYNVNICRLLEKRVKELEAQGVKSLIYCIGKRGEDYMRHRGHEIAKAFDFTAEVAGYKTAEACMRELFGEYAKGRLSEIVLAYTSFKNTITQTPELLKLMPFGIDPVEESASVNEIGPLMQYEPDEETVLAELVPQYLAGILYGALIEAYTSEHGARMGAMDSATENADAIIGDLTLQYNRVRQGKITQELTEIVNGANALE